jgi:hypothetical protein
VSTEKSRLCYLPKPQLLIGLLDFLIYPTRHVQFFCCSVFSGKKLVFNNEVLLGD